MKSLFALFLVMFVSGCMMFTGKPTYTMLEKETPYLELEMQMPMKTKADHIRPTEVLRETEFEMSTHSFSGYNNKKNSDSTSKSKWLPEFTKSEAIERAERLYEWIEDGPYDYWAARLVNHMNDYDVKFSDLSFTSEDLASKIWLNLWVENKEGG